MIYVENFSSKYNGTWDLNNSLYFKSYWNLYKNIAFYNMDLNIREICQNMSIFHFKDDSDSAFKTSMWD